MSVKIVIIGGGPAGLSAAQAAAERGIDATLFESGVIGDNINCGESFFDSMKLLEPPVGGICCRINELIIETDKTYKIDTKKFNIWMLDRREWQQELSRLARKTGAKIIENQKIGPEELRSLKRKYTWVLDASGVPPVSSLSYGFRSIYQDQSLITVQYRIKGDFSHLSGKIKAVLFKDVPGYGWIFPKGKEMANIGIGIFNIDSDRNIKGGDLYRRLDKFVEDQHITGSIKNRAAGVCPNKSPHGLIRENLILLGDAAGLTSPIHGGGIDLACLSGRYAVEAISRGDPTRYEKLLRQRVYYRLSLEEKLRRLWVEDYGAITRVIELMGDKRPILKSISLFLSNPGLLYKLLPYLLRIKAVYFK